MISYMVCEFMDYLEKLVSVSVAHSYRIIYLDESDDDEAPRRKRRLAEKAAMGNVEDEEVSFQ